MFPDWWSSVIWFTGWTLALLLSWAIVRDRRTPAATLSWLALVLVFPFIGAVIYLLIGTRKRERAQRAKLRVPTDYESHVSEASGDLAAFIQRIGPTKPSLNRVSMHHEAAASRRDLIDLIDGAQSEINFVVYTFERDESGQAVLHALREACKRGVTVRLLVDDMGSWNLNRPHMERLERSGGRIRRFNAVWSALYARTANLRNHRKIVVADAARAWTGCRNVGDLYLADDAEQSRWADLSFRVEGPAAAALDEICRADWHFATGESLPTPKAVPAPPAKTDAQHCELQVLACGPDQRDDAWHSAVMKGVMAARERIWIATPYFVPDEAVQTALAIAARSGVDVRILVPKKSDSGLVNAVSRTYLRELSRVGVKVFRYGPGMMHAKLALFDDDAITGSANMDSRSFFLNYEVVLYLPASPLVESLAAYFVRLEARSERGVRAHALWRETIAGLARLVSPML